MENLLSIFEFIHRDIVLDKAGIVIFLLLMFFMRKYNSKKKFDIVVGSILLYVCISLITYSIVSSLKENIENDKFIKIFKNIERENINIYVNEEQILKTNEITQIIYTLEKSEHIFVDRPRPSNVEILIVMKNKEYELEFHLNRDSKHKNVYGVFFSSTKNKKEHFIISYRIRTNIFNEYIPSQLKKDTNSGYIKTDYFNKDMVFIHKDLKEYFKELKTYKKKNLDVARIYTNIAKIYYKQNNLDKAIEFHNKSIKIKIPILGWNNISLIPNYKGLGDIWKKKEEYNIAKKFYKKEQYSMFGIYDLSNFMRKRNRNNLREIELLRKK